MSVRSDVLFPHAVQHMKYTCKDVECDLCRHEINVALDAVLRALTAPDVVAVIADQVQPAKAGFSSILPSGPTLKTVEKVCAAIQVVMRGDDQ